MGLPLLIFLVSGCAKDGDKQKPGESAGCAVVQEFSKTAVRITEPTTWTADRVYVFKSTIVEIHSELTIEAGTVLKFDSTSSVVVREGSNGRIIANGTADKRIVFTALTDPSHCDRVAAAGHPMQPKRGDWGGITIKGGDKHQFTYTDFLYAGGKTGEGSYSAVWFDNTAGGSFTFDHCVFAHTLGEPKQYMNSGSPGIHGAFEAAFQIDPPNPALIRFTNNVFYDNDVPMMINSYFPIDGSNRFHNPSNPQEKNDRNMISLFQMAHQEQDVTWGHTEVPYVFTGGTASHLARNSHTIRIGSNVIVKFPGPDGGINGHADIRIIDLHPKAILTSYHDDAHGGDTNGNGAATSPSKGDWLGFAIRRVDGGSQDLWIAGDNILYARFPAAN